MEMTNLVSDLRYAFARLIKKIKPAAIRGSTIHPTSTINGGSQVVQSAFDRHSYCGYDCVFLNVDVGSFCSISDNVIVGGSGHPIHFASTSSAFLSNLAGTKKKFARLEFQDLPRTKIGSDVWPGRSAIIRPRFEERMAKRLLATKWWSHPDVQITHWAKWLMSPKLS